MYWATLALIVGTQGVTNIEVCPTLGPGISWKSVLQKTTKFAETSAQLW